jgi:hypothetical protein
MPHRVALSWVPRPRSGYGPMTTLTLRRASKHRPGGQWSDDDYNVFDGERHVGRIMLTPQAPEGEPWFWTITARVPQYPHDRGYAASREEAMADFKVAWLTPARRDRSGVRLVYSQRSFAFASSIVCHSIFAGVSGPPRFKAMM